MNINVALNDPLAELKANVAVPFAEAHAMPKSVYTSEEFAMREVECIFRNEWYCAGRASALAKPGDYITLELAGQPIMVIRGKDGMLRAQSNVCLHRMSILLQANGNCGAIVCPYHGWTYNLDGTLRGAPAMAHNVGFEKSGYRLPQMRCKEWLGWVMVTLNPDIPSPTEKLADVEALISDYGMEAYVENFQERFVWNTNWKVLAENFMESYHLPVCHAQTIGGLSKLDEMVCPPGLPTFNYHTILKDDTLKIGLAHARNTRMVGERRRTTFLLAVYPSLLITLTPGYFWYLSLHPHGAGQVRVIFGGGLSPDFANDPDSQRHFAELKTLLDDVNIEDKGCTERVYRGLCSEMAQPGHLSHLERPNYDFATYIASMMR
jgi:phenylpropionate dioxygenase-like ring-hydroxylating dioxygenase large terminal subunit